MGAPIRVRWLASAMSTNDHWLARLRGGDPGAVPGAAVATARQLSGRGRQGRAWFDDGRGNLAFSVVVALPVDLRHRPALAQAGALAVVDALAAFGRRAAVKWPNDVLLDGAKVAGVLVEAPDLTPPRAVLGIGVNVGLSAPDATAATGRAVSAVGAVRADADGAVSAVCDALVAALRVRLDAWRRGGFPALREDWTRAVVGLDAPFPGPGGGTLRGFGEWGEALVADADGRVAARWSAGD